MWYGSKKSPNLNKLAKNVNYRLNLKDRRFAKPLTRKNSYPKINFTFQIPTNWTLVILRAKNDYHSSDLYYLYNNNYFLNFTLFNKSLKVKYDSQTRTLAFKMVESSYNYLTYIKTLSSLFIRFNRPFFLKIRFKGKGYYMYKTVRNTIAPQMGYAHRVYVYSSATSVRFLSKTKILIFGLSKKEIEKTAYSLIKVKPINIFTGRGVRFARQVIYKKTGKVGAFR